jgi:hypothetical protein
MLALRQLQTEVNALAWRHDNYTSPTSLTQYQNAAVIALQSGFRIEGRDVPTDPPSNPRETHSHLTRPHHPDRIIVWRPNNITFHGEDSIGNIGCYLCGGRHFTSEHAERTRNRQQPRREQRDILSPPPTYPETVGAPNHAAVAAAPPTAYEQIPPAPPPPRPNDDAASAVITAAIRRIDEARASAAGPSRRNRAQSPRTPYEERGRVRREPAAMQPTRRPLQQRLTEPRTRGTAAANRARAVTQRQINSRAHRNVRNGTDRDYYTDELDDED